MAADGHSLFGMICCAERAKANPFARSVCWLLPNAFLARRRTVLIRANRTGAAIVIRMGTALLFINFNLLVLPFAVFTNGNLTGFAGDFAAAIGRARAFALPGAAGALDRCCRFAFA